MSTQYKAAALISGDLDSLLAARVVMDQGIHVEGINFFTGFCVEGHTHAIRKQRSLHTKRNNAQWVVEQLGIRLLFSHRQAVFPQAFGPVAITRRT